MGLINHYYWFEAAEEDPDQPSRLHFFDDGDLGSMLLVTAASVLDTERARRATRSSSSSSCSARRPRRYFAEETLEYPLAAGVEPVEGLFPLDEIVSARIDFDALGDPRPDARPDRRERAAGPMTTVAVDRLVPVAGAPAAATGARRRRPRRRTPASSSSASSSPSPSPPRSPTSSSGPPASTASLDILSDAEHARAAALDGHPRRRRRARRPRSSAPAWPGSRRARDLPCRRVWAIAAPLPLVYPSFIGAAALLAAVAPGGLLDEVVPGDRRRLAPDRSRASGARGSCSRCSRTRTCTCPVAARLGALSPSLEESARLLGRGPLEVAPLRRAAADRRRRLGRDAARLPLRRVRLRRRRPAALPDAVGRDLRVPRVRPGPRPRARRPARRARRRRRGDASGPSTGATPRWRACGRSGRCRCPLGRWRWPAFAAVAFLAANALLGPLAVLGYWAVPGPHRDRPHRRRRPRRPRRADGDDGRRCRSPPPSPPSPSCCPSPTSRPATAAGPAGS